MDGELRVETAATGVDGHIAVRASGPRQPQVLAHRGAVLVGGGRVARGVEGKGAVARDGRGTVTFVVRRATAGAVADASTVAGPTAITPHELLKGLESLARFITEREKLQIVEMALGARPGTVETRTVKMNRGPGDSGATLVAEFVVVDPDAVLTPVIAKTALTELRAVLPAPVEELTLENPEPNNEYIQLTHPSTRSRALADFKEQHYVFVDLAAGVDEELDLPDPPVADWENELDALYSLTR